MKASNYQTLLDNLYEGVYYVDRDRKIKFWSKGAEIITGYKSTEILGKQCSDKFLSHTSLEGVSFCRSSCLMRNTIATGSYNKAEAYLRHKDGHDVRVSLRISPMFDSKGKVVGATHIFTNNELYLSSRPDEIKRNLVLYYDDLTKLPSRYNTELILKTKIEEFRRYHWHFATYLIEIDDFEKLRKSYSKDEVNGFTVQFSDLIKKDIRPFDIVGRWAENQFLVIMVNVDKKAMLMLGERMRKLIEETPFKVNETTDNLTLSQGCALIGENISNDVLITKLENLLGSSISAGGNQLTHYVY